MVDKIVFAVCFGGLPFLALLIILLIMIDFLT